ncbi:helix-turn-helix domain-containing protein [Mitsuaria sp. 7]|uniref:helix-turn-helix domain-containing protein n=1 Tax=Mitsuaria sp. 7 TaxID=1658665 RepID=UPI0007DDE7DC|nr:helix-turn-helix domain-containing protein [Mitsuaria sp. 7]ANH68255.1 hypothetical protein ABE85_13030 [Mitsuaria sp. 7]
MTTGTTTEQDHPHLIAFTEICGLFNCTESSLISMLRSGELPGVKLGRDWRIPRQAFWQRLNEMALEKAAERRQVMADLDHTPSPTSEVPVYPRTRGRPRLPR